MGMIIALLASTNDAFGRDQLESKEMKHFRRAANALIFRVTSMLISWSPLLSVQKEWSNALLYQQWKRQDDSFQCWPKTFYVRVLTFYLW